jgi:preprotein translocase subunit SecD
VIRGEIGGGRVQISGRMTTAEANDTAAAARRFAGRAHGDHRGIHHRPEPGRRQHRPGIHSVVWGLVAIAAFMCVYYMLFGVFSTMALAVNVLLLVAMLSMLQATLTLPGIAAMALALGMAIDSNVLINERIREELRAGASPQAAIHAGYERAWATILDSNVTTLIAGLALLAFGSGPVRGFAVVHCIGILTSMFSAVFFSRGLVNLWYGRKKKLKSVSIGQVWKPEGEGLVPWPVAAATTKEEDHGILPHQKRHSVHEDTRWSSTRFPSSPLRWPCSSCSRAACICRWNSPAVRSWKWPTPSRPISARCVKPFPSSVMPM